MKSFTQSTAHHIRSAYLRMHRVTNRVFHPYGVTADQYVLLRHLSKQDGISQQELGKLCASDPTTIGRMLQLLEKKEFVKREVDSTDRRTRLIYLTSQGRDMAKHLFEVCLPIRDALETTLSPNALSQLHRSLLKLSDEMDKLETELLHTLTE